MTPKSSLYLLAGFAESLITFRGALINALSTSGVSVTAVAPEEIDAVGRKKLTALNARAIVLPMTRTGTNPVSDLAYCARLFGILRREQATFVLGYTIKPVIYGTIAAWLAGVPNRFALVTGLGYAFTSDRKGLVTRLVRKLYAFALKRATKVFFQNPDDQQLFRETGLLPASIPSFVVHGSGVDVEAFPIAPLPSDATVFLLIGRLLGDKGVREFADAARQVKALHPQTRFRVVGWIDSNPDAIAQTELDAWVADGTIEFLGKLGDVRPAISASTVYVLPSYREGTPRTVLEAMAMGRPVITTDAPGCRETVVNGDNGFLVPVQTVDALVEAMLKFIEDPMLAQRMGQRSRQIAEDKYDVHKVNAVMLREMGITQTTTNGNTQK